MKRFLLFLFCVHSCLFVVSAALPPIEKVEIRDRVFYVNGQPFFPLMAWLQDAKNFPLLKDCAMNSTADITAIEAASPRSQNGAVLPL
jgi:hypothetical protein